MPGATFAPLGHEFKASCYRWYLPSQIVFKSSWEFPPLFSSYILDMFLRLWYTYTFLSPPHYTHLSTHTSTTLCCHSAHSFCYCQYLRTVDYTYLTWTLNIYFIPYQLPFIDKQACCFNILYPGITLTHTCLCSRNPCSQNMHTTLLKVVLINTWIWKQKT